MFAARTCSPLAKFNSSYEICIQHIYIITIPILSKLLV